MTKKEVNILILAAGSSSRLGEPKQLLKLNGKTLLQRSIESGLEISDSVTVVLGANWKLIEPTISHYDINWTINENWEEGMSSSIRTGIEFLSKKNPKSTLIMLCDQPFVNAHLLEKIILTFEKSEQPIIASSYKGKLGVPALFNISFFEKLKNLQGQKGAKALIMNHLEQVESVEFEKGEIDIDTQEAWKRFLNEHGEVGKT